MSSDMTDRSANRVLPTGAETLEEGACSTRRGILGGGLLLSMAALLQGCGGGRQQASLPAVNWPDPPMVKPVTPSTRAPTPMAHAAASHGSVPIIPRSAWTGRGVARKTTDPMGRIAKITVHHEGNLATGLRSQAQVAKRLESIRRYHVDQKGWADIGYHYVIDPMGRVWEARDTSLQGAHVGGIKNEHNLGVMVMGNFDIQSPTSDQVSTLDRFLIEQMRRYNVRLTTVYTHQELGPTECPGTRLQKHMVNIRATRGGSLARLAAGSGLA